MHILNVKIVLKKRNIIGSYNKREKYQKRSSYAMFVILNPVDLRKKMEVEGEELAL